MKLLSTEAEGVNVAIPEAERPTLVNAQGRVGALLGLKSSEPGIYVSQHRCDISTIIYQVCLLRTEVSTGAGMPQKVETTPLTEVQLVNVKLLTLKELQLITEQGAAGRQKLDTLFEGQQRLISSLSRPSVV